MVCAPHQVMFSISNVSPLWFLMCFQAPRRPWGALILPVVKRRGSPSLSPVRWIPGRPSLGTTEAAASAHADPSLVPELPGKGQDTRLQIGKSLSRNHRGFFFGFQAEGRTQTLPGRLRNLV